MDSGALDRIGERAPLFQAAKLSVCIDHHSTSTHFCDYNYIDPKSAATGQLAFLLIKELEIVPDKRIAKLGLCSDYNGHGEIFSILTLRKLHMR